jgi:hypothetical protein
MDRYSLCLAKSSHGEANDVFTLMNSEISINKVKISSTSKTLDMFD